MYNKEEKQINQQSLTVHETHDVMEVFFPFFVASSRGLIKYIKSSTVDKP